MEERIKRLRELIKESQMGGGEEKIRIQHRKGKLTARERIDLLVDEETFVEFDRFVLSRETSFGLDKKRKLGDGVVTG
ncbi:methylmalonyl-CoA carboxyltransferase, partial [Candidatus Geothermarchaeota archaeon]